MLFRSVAQEGVEDEALVDLRGVLVEGGAVAEVHAHIAQLFESASHVSPGLLPGVRLGPDWQTNSTLIFTRSIVGAIYLFFFIGLFFKKKNRLSIFLEN